MTVVANDRRKEYPGNDTATEFVGPRALSASHLVVYLVDNTTGDPVQQTAFTLTGLGKASTTITMDTAPPTGKTLLILRTLPFTQECDISNQGKYLPEVVEESGLDPLEMQIQQIVDKLLRVLVGSELAVGDDWDFDAEGRKIINLGDATNPADAMNLRTFLQQLGEFEASGLNTDPLYWDLGGDTDGTTATFFIPGANVTSPVFYDVFVAGVAIEPTDGYSVTITPDITGSTITFVTPPGNGVNAWVVLRGYARPLNNDLLTALLNSQAFLDLLAQIITNTLYESDNVLRLGALRYLIPLLDVTDTTFTVDGTRESYLLRCTNAAATTLTVRANTGTVGDTLDFETNPVAAPFWSTKQAAGGQVSIVGDVGVTVSPPAGYLAKTRAPGSIITATCDYAAGGVWTLTGDLAIDPDYINGQAVTRYNKTLATAFSSSVTAKADVTGWAFPVASGKTYRVRVLGTYQSAATTTGGSIALTGDGVAAGTVNGRATGAIAAGAVATALAATLDALGDALTTTGVSAINTPHWIEMDVVLVCSASGTVSIQWASEVAASAAQLNAGSLLTVEEVVLTP